MASMRPRRTRDAGKRRRPAARSGWPAARKAARPTREALLARIAELEDGLKRQSLDHQRLLALVDRLPVGVWITDAAGKMLVVNDHARAIWGGHAPLADSTEEYAVYRIFRPDSDERVPAREMPLSRALRGEESRGVVLDFERFDGRRGRQVVSAAPVRGPDGAVSGGLAIVQDITELWRTEQALREAEKKYRELVRFAPAGIYEADFRTRRFTSVNDAVTEILGYSREELLAMSPLDILVEDGKARFEDRMARWLAGEQPDRHVEYKVKAKDGRVIDALLAVSFTRDPEGRPVGATAVAQDITERKRMEEALRQSREALRAANERLVEADRRKNEFLAVLSHELRNPLAPIANSLYVLDRAAPGGDQAARAKQVIERQVAQLSSLVNDLLDVTRITRNKVQLQKTTIELNETVRRVVEDHRSLFDRAGVALELLPSPGPVLVQADATRFPQIVGNLLQNSAKFTSRGGHTRVSVAAEGSEAVVRVADDGAGMSRETLGRLFLPFSQAEQTLDRSKGGLGLGLALVKGLVELHGGTVAARSEGLGRGTELTVRLPRDGGAALEAPRARAGAARTRRRVLVIEDNADAADSLRDALAFGGHEVAVAYDGPAGIRLAREFAPEVVLCDIGLPGMDGYEVARAFRADATLRRTFLVALSGYALPMDLEQAAGAGFERHLAKPPDHEKLEQLLAEVPRALPPQRTA